MTRLIEERLRQYVTARGGPQIENDALSMMLEAADEIERLRQRDTEAAEYVESVICMRTHFTGEEPYVGWKGLGLALREALDERDFLRKENAELKIDWEVMTKIIKIAVPYAVQSLKYANSPQRHKVQADLRRIREILELSSD